METKQLLGARIKSLRRARERTQEEVAERVGLSVNYLSRIERGLENPTLDLLLGIAEMLKVEPVDLFTFEHEEPDPKRLRQFLARLVAEAKDHQLSHAVKVLRSVLR
jgi:transcriptional regulator with XRE-family HTH domain